MDSNRDLELLHELSSTIILLVLLVPRPFSAILPLLCHICSVEAAVDETGAPLPDRNVYCSTGVYTIPVFRSDVNAELVEEILHAKSSALGPALSLPVS